MTYLLQILPWPFYLKHHFITLSLESLSASVQIEIIVYHIYHHLNALHSYLLSVFAQEKEGSKIARLYKGYMRV